MTKDRSFIIDMFIFLCFAVVISVATHAGFTEGYEKGVKDTKTECEQKLEKE
jgi:hypothetical protein